LLIGVFMDKATRRKWDTINSTRSAINHVQTLASIGNAMQGLNTDQYNTWFLERCKTLAKWTNGRAENLFPRVKECKSVKERLEVIATAFSYYEPNMQLLATGRVLLGRTCVSASKRPSLQVSASLGNHSALRPFIIAHELTHLLVHLEIPQHVRRKSGPTGNDKALSFEETFDVCPTPIPFGEDDPSFQSSVDAKKYILDGGYLQRAREFQGRREEIFHELSGKNLSKYYKEVACDLVAAFWPLVDFCELYPLLSSKLQGTFQKAQTKQDLLLDALDYASWAYAQNSDSTRVREADQILTRLVDIGFESGWFSPLQILLSIATLVNFKIQPRAFDLGALGSDFIKQANVAFFDAVGIDVRHVFVKGKLPRRKGGTRDEETQ
jgi:hypothetical protein